MIHSDLFHQYSFIRHFCIVCPIAHSLMMVLQFHIKSDSHDCNFSSIAEGKKVYFSESKVTFEKCD